MNNSPQYNQQIEPKQCKHEADEICIYQNLESSYHQYLYPKRNSGFHARKNLKQQYLKAVTFSDASMKSSFSKKFIHVYENPA